MIDNKYIYPIKMYQNGVLLRNFDDVNDFKRMCYELGLIDYNILDREEYTDGIWNNNYHDFKTYFIDKLHTYIQKYNLVIIDIKTGIILNYRFNWDNYLNVLHL